MSLTPPKKNQSFDPVPAGNHVCRLYEIIHIGTMPTEWKGEQKMTDKIRMTFELCNEKKEFKEGEGEKPFSISREFTYSFGAKGNLRPFIDGMTGTKMGDGEILILKHCWVMRACSMWCIPKRTATPMQTFKVHPRFRKKAPELSNQPRLIDINSTPWEIINALPEFILKKMYSSEEFSNRKRADEMLGGKKVGNYRPKAVGGEDVIEYPAEEVNSDDVPF